jgi:DNA polymerase-3 subunit epsilon
MLNLHLTRPLVAIDTETTGLLPDARIVEIGLVRIDPDGAGSIMTALVDPGVPIPPAATAIHGIGDDGVRGCPPWRDVYHDVIDFLADGDLCGFNLVGFDLGVLWLECRAAGLDFDRIFADRHVIDPMIIYHFYHAYQGRGRGRRNLAAAVRTYLGREHRGHSAEADACAALEVLDAQVVAHGLPRTVPELDQYPFVPERRRVSTLGSCCDACDRRRAESDPAEPPAPHPGLRRG